MIILMFIESSDKQMLLYTWHTKEEFNLLLMNLPLLIHDLGQQKASDALCMYLMKIRTGKSHEEVSTHFGVSKTTVQRRCDAVRERLKATIVPLYMNFKRNRADLISRKSAMSHVLFDNGSDERAHLILDATYIYLEKSQSHRFQKESFNSHKKRNYFKIMMGVSTDGTILFSLGPYKATENDAMITKKILHEASSIFEAFQPGDVMFVDRGFRDCVTDLMNHGYLVKMPACSHQAQLTTMEANQSRLVTKVRYEVEKANGVMKNIWRIFSRTIESPYIPNIMVDFEIGVALVNRKLKSSADCEKQTEMANRMLSRMNVVNELSKIINRPAFEKLIKLKSYDELTDFSSVPALTIEDLKSISFGVYQIEQARCYLSNHLYERGNSIEMAQFFTEDVRQHCGDLVVDMDVILLYMHLKSRFVSRKAYRVFVLIDKNGHQHESILQYCCSCKVGNRTVGCCSHVMSLLYYVTHAPHNGGVREVCKHLSDVFDCPREDEETEDDAE